MKVAHKLERSAIGYEIDLELKPIIQTKVGGDVDSVVREDSKHLRTELQKRVDKKKK